MGKNKKNKPKLELPTEVYYHVDDNWGSSGVAGAEYVYNLFAADLEDLKLEIESLARTEQHLSSNQSRIDEAVAILTG